MRGNLQNFSSSRFHSHVSHSIFALCSVFIYKSHGQIYFQDLLFFCPLEGELINNILHGPIELAAGIAVGLIWGVVAGLVPHKDEVGELSNPESTTIA